MTGAVNLPPVTARSTVAGLAAAATLGLRWVVNRLDEFSEARASHRALLAATGGVPALDAPRPGEPTAV